jgi:hypothetical protein
VNKSLSHRRPADMVTKGNFFFADGGAGQQIQIDDAFP